MIFSISSFLAGTFEAPEMNYMTDKSALVISHAAASRGVVITVYILCSILMVGLSGCAGSIKIQRPIHLGDLDWLNYGKDCGRTNRTANVLDPPLRLLWEYDASAGIGTGSPVVMDSIVLFCTLTGELHAVKLPPENGSGMLVQDRLSRALQRLPRGSLW
jgi:hypothetical protein